MSRKGRYPDKQKGVEDNSNISRDGEGTLELQKGKWTVEYPCSDVFFGLFRPNKLFINF